MREKLVVAIKKTQWTWAREIKIIGPFDTWAEADAWLNRHGFLYYDNTWINRNKNLEANVFSVVDPMNATLNF